MTRKLGGFLATLAGRLRSDRVPDPIEVPANMDLHHSPRAARALDHLRRTIRIDVDNDTAEDSARAAHFDMALTLTRQDDWTRLAELLRLHDGRRSITPSGRAVTDLILDGAAHDLGTAISACGSGGTPGRTTVDDLRYALSSYEDMHREQPDDWARAVIAAEAHMAVARQVARSARQRRAADTTAAFVAHAQERAAALLDTCAPSDDPAPALLLARARLALGSADLGGSAETHLRQAIAIAPGYATAHSALCIALLPGKNGDLSRLPGVARDAMRTSRRFWGRGGYAWVFMEALQEEPATLATLDADLFLQGINDILDRHPRQFLANLWTSYLGVAMAPRTGWSALPPAAEAVRADLHAHAGPLMRRHLRKLHPQLWHQSGSLGPAPAAGAPYAPTPDQQTVRGADQAFWVIGRQFEKELAKGCTIVVSDRGWQLQRGA